MSGRGSTRRPGTRAAVVVSAACCLVAGCVPASPGPSAYEDKAAMTVESALSEVATVQLALEALDRGRAFRPAVITQLRYSEDNLDTATGAFTELNPPKVDDRLHRRSEKLLTEAGDLLARTRIAVARGRRDLYPRLSRHLATLAGRLDDLDKQVAS
jgi:hypothetical protein